MRPGTHGGALLVVAHSEGVHHFLLVEAHLHQGHDGLREGTQSLSTTRGPRGPPRSQAAPAWSLRGSRGCFDTDPPGRPSPAASSQHNRNASGFLNQPRGEAFSRAALARGPRPRGLQDLGLCSSAHAPFTVPSTAGKGGGSAAKRPPASSRSPALANPVVPGTKLTARPLPAPPQAGAGSQGRKVDALAWLAATPIGHSRQGRRGGVVADADPGKEQHQR